MLKIVNPNFEIEIEFNGIKIFDVENTNLFYRDVILKSNIYLEDYKIKDENIIYINNFAKICDFINLSKKSFLFSKINELLFENKIVNFDSIKNIVDIVNNNYNYELLEINEGDTGKLINMFFELTNDKYLDKKVFEIILKDVFEEKKLIIIDNLEWIEIDWLANFLNSHNFIILTNNFKKYISKNREFEILTIIKEKYEYIDILDLNHLCNYLQLKLDINIDHNNIVELINKNDQISQQIIWKLRNI